MFDLDQAIAHWRRQMAAGGIKTPTVLDELEGHLREDVEQQVRSGVNAQQAFDAAALRIGTGDILKAEFARADGTSRGLQKLMIFVCVILVGLIVLASGFTFFFIGFGPGEQLVAYAAVISSLLVACRWRYAAPFLPALPSCRNRTVLAFLCIVTGFVCSSLFAQVVLPHFEHNRDGLIPAIGFWLLFPIALGFGLAGGIQETVRRKNTKAGS